MYKNWVLYGIISSIGLTNSCFGQNQISNKVIEFGLQQTKVTDFDGDAPKFSFYIGYEFLKTKKRFI